MSDDEKIRGVSERGETDFDAQSGYVPPASPPKKEPPPAEQHVENPPQEKGSEPADSSTT